MKFSEFIVKEAIRPQLAATDRDGVLRELVEALAAAGAIPRTIVEEVVTALVKRERTGSTGFGRGVAVPHVKHPRIKKMAGTVGNSTPGIDFAALDHQPVHTIVILLSPESQPQQHLAAMNVIFTNLQDDNFRRFMRQARDVRAIEELLDEADQGR
jgi:mannitol/fructose-specific phosphotransferase system IIA component (Ntr-type)